MVSFVQSWLPAPVSQTNRNLLSLELPAAITGMEWTERVESRNEGNEADCATCLLRHESQFRPSAVYFWVPVRSWECPLVIAGLAATATIISITI